MGEYINNEPITCDLMVLDLLYDDRWECRIDRRLHLPHPHASDDRKPYVRVMWSEGRPWDFVVARGVGERLLSDHMVQGTPHWGYTDDRDLTISDYGRTLMRETYERLGVRYSFEDFHRRLRTERWLRAAE